MAQLHPESSSSSSTSEGQFSEADGLFHPGYSSSPRLHNHAHHNTSTERINYMLEQVAMKDRQPHSSEFRHSVENNHSHEQTGYKEQKYGVPTILDDHSVSKLSARETLRDPSSSNNNQAEKFKVLYDRRSGLNPAEGAVARPSMGPQDSDNTEYRKEMSMVQGQGLQHVRYQDCQRVRSDDSSKDSQVQKIICFDMHKVNKIGYPDVRKLRVTPLTPISQTITAVFNTVEDDVVLVQNQQLSVGQSDRCIVILAKNALTSVQYVIVECLIFSAQPYPELLCVRIPVIGIQVSKLCSDISREIGLKRIVLCDGGHLLENEMVIRNDGGQVKKMKAVHSTRTTVRCVHLPTNNVKSVFEIQTDSGASVRHLKEEFLRQFKKDIKLNEDETIHFSFQGKILDGSQCIRVVTWPCEEVTLQVHMVTPGAICINLVFKEPVVKNKVPKSKSIAIDPSLSTENLRKEVAKHISVDPKAVKLTLNGRRIEEMDCINDIGDLENGCTLFAGVKKKKVIRVRNVATNQEETFRMFMLEGVHVLKRMISEKFGIRPLHISLEYKSRTLADSELLLNYPIKNQTEIKMQVFPNRINVQIYIVFKKVRTALMIDNANTTTVNEVIQFCGITFDFDTHCAKIQYCNHCLSGLSTLSEENLQNGSKLVIVPFDQPEKLDVGVIRLFTVRPDGQVNSRLGAINGGLLMHAPKKAKPPPLRGKFRNTEQIPDGIRISEEFLVMGQRSVVPKSKKSAAAVKFSKRHQRVSELQMLKKKFMKKAKEVKRKSEKRTISRQQPHPELESQESHHRADQADSFETPLNTSELDDDSETELKEVSKSTGQSTQEEDGLTMNIEVNIEDRVSCIQNCCSEIKDMLDSTKDTDRIPESIQESIQLSQTVQREDGQTLQLVSNQRSFVMEEKGRDIGKPGYCDTSGSASDLQQNGMRAVEFTLGTDSSDQEAQQAPNAQLLAARELCYWRTCPSFRRMAVIGNRRRTTTEGQLDLATLSQHSHTYMISHSVTHPLMTLHNDGNDWLTTSGITMNILDTVGRKIGGKWKFLARKLTVPEEEIENIEHLEKSLQEKAFEAVLYWKKFKGTSASKQVLIQALRDIEMVALAEAIEQYCDYQTV